MAAAAVVALVDILGVEGMEATIKQQALPRLELLVGMELEAAAEEEVVALGTLI